MTVSWSTTAASIQIGARRSNWPPVRSQRCHENSRTSVGWASRGLGIGFEDDSIAEAFEAAFEVGDGSGLADLVEIGFAEIAIGQVLSEHVIGGGDENFVGDGERGAQAAAAGLEAVELVLEVAALKKKKTGQTPAQAAK